MLAWLFVAGGGVVGWLLYLSSDDRADPAPVVAVAAKSPDQVAAPEGLTLRLTIVTPDGEKSQDVEVLADPVPHVAPAAVRGGDDRPRGGRPSNIVTYDDSNVVIGGTGKVNAQIGDSDTAGAVVMGVVDSHVEAGDAF